MDQPSALHNVARALCPKLDRPWLDALLAESSAIHSQWARWWWLTGAVQLLLSCMKWRLFAATRGAWGILLAVSLASFVVCVIVAWFGVEINAMDDDVFLALSGLLFLFLLGGAGITVKRTLHCEGQIVIRGRGQTEMNR